MKTTEEALNEFLLQYGLNAKQHIIAASINKEELYKPFWELMCTPFIFYTKDFIITSAASHSPHYFLANYRDPNHLQTVNWPQQ